MRIVIILATCLLAAGAALADSATLSFPALTGGYEADAFTPPNPGFPQVRTVDFTIPAGITAIDQLELVVSGDWHEGEIVCDDGSGPQTSPFSVGLSIFLSVDAYPGDYFRAGVSPPNGSFTDLAATVSSCCPPGVLDYATLLGAEIHAEFSVDWALVGICWISDDSYGTVQDVRLEILGTVRTEHETWSSVKALYR